MRISRLTILHVFLFAFLPLCLCSMAFTANAQQQSTQGMQPAGTTPDPFQNMAPAHHTADSAAHNPNPHIQQMLDSMALERNQKREEKITSQSAQLLALAEELNADIAKSNKSELSVSVVKEAGEIEKLAISIKIKTSDAY